MSSAACQTASMSAKVVCWGEVLMAKRIESLSRGRSAGVGAGGAQCVRAVARAEQHGVDEQWVQLVERHPTLMSVGERVRLGVGRIAASAEATEQAHHREIRLPMPAVGPD